MKKRKKSRLDCFEAWCSGTAYQKPDRFVFNDNTRTIGIATGWVVLGYFKLSKKDYEMAKATHNQP